MKREILVRDTNTIEAILEETANDPRHKYIYAMAVVLWHLLQDKLRHEKV